MIVIINPNNVLKYIEETPVSNTTGAAKHAAQTIFINCVIKMQQLLDKIACSKQ